MPFLQEGGCAVGGLESHHQPLHVDWTPMKICHLISIAMYWRQASQGRSENAEALTPSSVRHVFVVQ